MNRRNFIQNLPSIGAALVLPCVVGAETKTQRVFGDDVIYIGPKATLSTDFTKGLELRGNLVCDGKLVLGSDVSILSAEQLLRQG